MSKRNKQRAGDGDEDWNQDHHALRARGSDASRIRSGIDNGWAGPDAHNSSRQGIASQPELNLGEYTQAAKNTVDSMRQTHDAVKNLAEKYLKHIADIEEISKTRSAYTALAEQVKFKDKKIKEHKITIDTLKDGTREKEAKLAADAQRISDERSKLEREIDKVAREKETVAKRQIMQQAEGRNKLDKELQKLKSDHERILLERKTALEDDMRKQKQANEKVLAELEVANTSLREKLNEYQQQVEEQKKEIARILEASDDQERVKRTLREETRSLKGKLKTMQNEFCLNNETTEYYKTKFGDICHGIGSISIKYFRYLPRVEDAETTSKTFANDEFKFTSIPISQSQVSQQLRVAHAQSFLSAYFCKAVWQPFSAEKTFLNHELLSFLDGVAGALADCPSNSSGGGRSSRVWGALTMRALHSSAGTGLHPQASSLQQYLSRYSTKVVDKVFSSLSHLVEPSQRGAFRSDLLALTESAVSVWCTAQTDELEITISSSLDQTRYEEWHSSILETTSSPPEGNRLASDDGPSVQTLVYTMFPHIVAKMIKTQDRPTDVLPGSWPDSYQEPMILETCIHTGIGLPESSELVMRGKQEVEETKVRLDQEQIREEIVKLEQRNCELEARRGRVGKHSQNSSAKETGPPSPTVLWTREGAKKVVEES